MESARVGQGARGPRAAAATTRGHLFVLVGPSGGGKTTLIREVSGYDRAAPPAGPGATEPEFLFVPSTTSRSPRAGERHGVDYFFVDEGEFCAQWAAAGFLEVQRVHGHHYGSSRGRLCAAIDAGRQAITAADILGAFKIKAAMPADVTTVFVTPSRAELLRERILARGRVTEAELARRLARVEMEMELACACDHLVLNDDLRAAVAGLRVLAAAQRLQALRLRHFGQVPVVRMIDLGDPPAPHLTARFCVSDCETLDRAARRVLRQWWWELHPEATAFDLPAACPAPAGARREEHGSGAVLSIHPWSLALRPGALADCSPASRPPQFVPGRRTSP